VLKVVERCSDRGFHFVFSSAILTDTATAMSSDTVPVAFKQQLAPFALTVAVTAPALRRSPRKKRPLKERSLSPLTPTGKESDHSEDTEEPRPRPSPKKRKRGYAPPETYAHLRALQDHLKEDLHGEFTYFKCPLSNRGDLTSILPAQSYSAASSNSVVLPSLSFLPNTSSPGYKSASIGHHFANPSNHFWRCLHRSGAVRIPSHCPP
jgi:hypothetical protein